MVGAARNVGWTGAFAGGDIFGWGWDTTLSDERTPYLGGGAKPSCELIDPLA